MPKAGRGSAWNAKWQEQTPFRVTLTRLARPTRRCRLSFANPRCISHNPEMRRYDTNSPGRIPVDDLVERRTRSSRARVATWLEFARSTHRRIGPLAEPTATPPRVKLVNDCCRMRYDGNPKHKHPWQAGRRGSLCPREIGAEVAQTLLDGSVPDGGARYATWNGRAFCAREHQEGLWHGYPVGWHEVPPPIRNKWLRDGVLKRSDLGKHW